VGEIPTLKTRAELHRNIMLYELLSDYEILHLQLQRIAREVVSLISRCCRKRCARPTTFEELQMSESFWRPLRVYAETFIHLDQLEQDNFFLIRFFKWLGSKISQNDIETHIAYQKHWKKRNLKKQPGQENNDVD
jgi:hypothetical protein